MVGLFTLWLAVINTIALDLWADITISFQVGLDNLEEYISLVVDSTVKTGIRPQIESFRAGFNQVLLLVISFWDGITGLQ